MIKNLSFLLLMIAIIINIATQQVLAEVNLKNVHEKSVQTDHPYRPITFPASEEDQDLVVDRFSSSFPMPPSSLPPPPSNVNSLIQEVDQKIPVASSPPVELQRPTRVAIAATSSSDVPPSQFADEQLDYVRDFSWTLFQKSKIPSPIGNLIQSPIQPLMQLSLLQTASAGATAEEIARAIHERSPQITKNIVGKLRTLNHPSTNMGLASAIFAQNSLKLNTSFVNAAHERNVDLVPVNFADAEEAKYVINNWVANSTNNHIKELLISADGLSTDSKIILTNSIYFNGEWKYGFTGVKSEPFYTTERLTKNVQMMKNVASLRAGTMILRNGFSGQWVELPYRGDDFSMVLILPVQRHYLDEFIRSMSTNEFADVIKQLASPYKKLVHLSLPKFTISSSFSMVNVLLKMGIVNLFTSVSNLPYVTATGELLRVQDIVQQSYISVDEKGTIAAAATFSHVVTLSLNSAPEEIHFNVDQPFLSIIVDKRNKVPIFISKIFDP